MVCGPARVVTRRGGSLVPPRETGEGRQPPHPSSTLLADPRRGGEPGPCLIRGPPEGSTVCDSDACGPETRRTRDEQEGRGGSGWTVPARAARGLGPEHPVDTSTVEPLVHSGSGPVLGPLGSLLHRQTPSAPDTVPTGGRWASASGPGLNRPPRPDPTP